MFPDKKDTNDLLSIEEVASKLKVSVNTIYAWVNQRRIPFVKVGRLLRFQTEAIELWIAERIIKAKYF